MRTNNQKKERKNSISRRANVAKCWVLSLHLPVGTEDAKNDERTVTEKAYKFTRIPFRHNFRYLCGIYLERVLKKTMNDL
jgi:hypothetical protein